MKGSVLRKETPELALCHMSTVTGGVCGPGHGLSPDPTSAGPLTVDSRPPDREGTDSCGSGRRVCDVCCSPTSTEVGPCVVDSALGITGPFTHPEYFQQPLPCSAPEHTRGDRVCCPSHADRAPSPSPFRADRQLTVLLAFSTRQTE